MCDVLHFYHGISIHAPHARSDKCYKTCLIQSAMKSYSDASAIRIRWNDIVIHCDADDVIRWNEVVCFLVYNDMVI